MARPRILVSDGEPGFVDEVRRMLGATCEVDDGRGQLALDAVAAAGAAGRPYDVVLLDGTSPGGGLAVLRSLAAADARVVVTTSSDRAELAVEALRAGAADVLVKPVGRAELRVRVERVLGEERAPASGVGELPRRPRKDDVIVGGGPWVKDLFERISMAAPTDVAVAIYGESGTGKELVARTLHNLSNRRQGPFVVVNCAAIPEGLLEDELFGHVRGAFTDATRDREGLMAAADGGTLFLDEISEMSLALQAKMLRVLQSHEFRRIGDDHDMRVDVRLITATNRPLEEAVKVGLFRQDLYYRINVFPLRLPPLRERREDIPLLAQHFLVKHRARLGKRIERFSPAALSRLVAHDFPGNVRELENRVHHALVMAQGDVIEADDVQTGSGPARPPSPIDLGRTFKDLKREVVEGFERDYVRALLEHHGGNLAAAARQAGMDRKNLWAFVRKYAIDLDRLRRR
jgi:two-component system, NtrC family, response regulator HydG